MWSTRAISAEEISSPTTIIAAPMRFATERNICSVSSSPVGTNPTLSVPASRWSATWATRRGRREIAPSWVKR